MKEAKSLQLSKQDIVIIIGGTNSISTEDTYGMKKALAQLIEDGSFTNIIHTTTPYRHDSSLGSFNQFKFNKRVSIWNSILCECLEQHCNFSTLPLNNLLYRRHYTTHGFHLNRHGKEEVCAALALYTKTYLQQKTSILKTTKIRLIEANMKKIILHHSDKGKVAFAHSISADIENEKQMSKGVAVVFKNCFGKPGPRDFVARHLTYQKSQNRAAVYGLVTKPKYFSKPVKLDYDIAFQHLAKDVQRRGIKTLICTPMGCSRDGIDTAHFAKNIVSLHLQTNISVDVIIYNEKSAKQLRNGLNFEEFKLQLQESIDHELQSVISCNTEELCCTNEISTDNKDYTDLQENDNLTRNKNNLNNGEELINLSLDDGFSHIRDVGLGGSLNLSPSRHLNCQLKLPKIIT